MKQKDHINPQITKNKIVKSKLENALSGNKFVEIAEDDIEMNDQIKSNIDYSSNVDEFVPKSKN